jgi:hypothetical protein
LTVPILPHLALALFTLAALAGCGGAPASSAIRTARPTSVVPAAPAIVVAQGYEQQVRRAPGSAYQQPLPPVAAALPRALTARVAAARNGLLLGLGTFRATIVVDNPTSERRSGILVVTFTRNGRPVEGEPFRQPVALDAGGTETFEVTDRRWTTDGARAAVEHPDASVKVP